MFKESDHVEFVSAFLYQNLGLNVPADDITVQLSDTSFDKVTFDYDVDIDNLNCMLDLYISELIKHNASYSDSILLKKVIAIIKRRGCLDAGQLCEEADIEFSQAASALLELEIEGYIENVGLRGYRIKRVAK